jgi:hypothetical protein
MGLKALIEEAYINGKNCYTTFRKVSALVTVAGFWVDLSMTTGNPVPNYYVGAELTATIPTEWYKKGIWHGGNVSPDVKFVHKIMISGHSAGASPAPYTLCDYLMYYPLIDMDNTDDQILINYGATLSDTTDPTAATLPRYQDGKGVQAFLVATNPYVGGQYFYITYTNSDGVAGRKSKLTQTNTSTNIGTIVNSNTAGVGRFGAFIELQQGDIGIRSVQNVTFLGSNGGLATLVLVKPIENLWTREFLTYPTTSTAGTYCEFDFIKDKSILPRVYDGAYLNFLVMPSGSLAAIPITGEFTTIWGS